MFPRENLKTHCNKSPMSILVSRISKLVCRSKMIWLIIVTLALCSCFFEQVSVVDSLSAEQRVQLPANYEECPDTWFVQSGSDGECKCGHKFDGVVSCNEETREVRVLDCYCITYDSTTNKTVLGQVPLQLSQCKQFIL